VFRELLWQPVDERSEDDRVSVHRFFLYPKFGVARDQEACPAGRQSDHPQFKFTIKIIDASSAFFLRLSTERR
jgi:hypothetical protein